MAFNSTSGDAQANSYASVEASTTYYSDRNVTEWDGPSTNQRQAALIKATDYIDASYVHRSKRATDTQALEYPRLNETEINPLIVKATIVLAIHMLTDDANAKEDEKQVQILKQSLAGVGSTETTYSDKRFDPYPFVTDILKPVASRRGSDFSVIIMDYPR